MESLSIEQGLLRLTTRILLLLNKMTSSTDFIASGDFTIGTLDSKSRIAPITQNGKPVMIMLSPTPELQTPFSPWPSYDGGERTSLDLVCTPELSRLADHIDDVIERQVTANPTRWWSKVPKMSTTTPVAASYPSGRGLRRRSTSSTAMW